MINIAADDLALVEILLDAQRKANALDGYHAWEHEGTYGALKEAIITALTIAVNGNNRPTFSPYARRIAIRIYDEAIDNGEDIAYNVALFNEGVITL